jgi:hypothetical protein
MSNILNETNPSPASIEGFSLVSGGPTYRLQQRLGLIKPGAPDFARRAVLSILLTWVPLLILSAVEGLAIGKEVRIPFLGDFAVYTRFLVALPLLIQAEGSIDHRVALLVSHLVHSGLIPERNHAGYESALHRARNLSDSTLAEVVLLGLAALTVVAARQQFHFDFSTWRSLVSHSSHTRTLAGWWYQIVSMGLFQFLVWRWVWRLLVWYWFLWRVSKLDLQLIPTHPDRAAGLGCVGETQRSFWKIIFALSAGIAGSLADEIVYAGVPLKSYEVSVGAYVVGVLLICLGPLLMFVPRLTKAKIRSLHNYSTFAVTHNRLFDGKWVQGNNPKGDPVLGAPDISSLANLGNAYKVLEKMKLVPFDRADVLFLALAAVIPMAPLLLTVVPLEKLFELMGKALL